MRGEQRQDVTVKILDQGSPPHARGTEYTVITNKKTNGITPACAGNRKYEQGAGGQF